MLRFTVLACLLLAANAAPEETIPEALQDLMDMADADPTQFAADLKVRMRLCPVSSYESEVGGGRT